MKHVMLLTPSSLKILSYTEAESFHLAWLALLPSTRRLKGVMADKDGLLSPRFHFCQTKIKDWHT